MTRLEGLPLHDAIVRRIVILWEERIVEFDLLAFAECGEDASPHSLRFMDVRNFNCPRLDPWGESSFINEATGSDGNFSIQMQSGDEITIEAIGCSFERERATS
ncbi:hypothetical protein [Methylobacter luteus]|uniref:hypothetical protein n=1 Tax=Methylobacter luteus TaxID=415 RepID=UPI0004840F85|nr:hypothetical protein [Methylobacter luteus]